NIHTDKIYETEREYLKAHIPLMPSGASLPVGRHQFPLRIFVPETAPSSYESQFGTNRYTIKVVLKTNSEQSTCTEVFPFIVVARSFFDDIPQSVMKNVEFKDEVDFTCCSLPFGTVSIKIALPRTGYKIGEVITCSVMVYNRTRKALKECSLQVVLKTQFEAMSRYEHVNEKKLTEQVIEAAALGNIKSRNDVQFDNCLLKLPESVPPTQYYNKHSPDPNIIALTYTLRFIAFPGIEMEIPLVVTARGYRDGHKCYVERSYEVGGRVYMC
uniref:Arrestin C-terminal-like domain-containing protein n=2 Tax=Parascaris TaxID=6254 RepID=A0A915BYD9_PARUN